MKDYISIKEVQAKPMTVGEAKKLGLIRVNSMNMRSSDETPGYLVKYPDGYESWSPKEIFEAAYTVSATPLDRLNIEQNALAHLIVKLDAFVYSDKYEALDKLSQAMLVAQLKSMIEYMTLLDKRLFHMQGQPIMLSGLNFRMAHMLIEAGYCVRRSGWNGKDLMVTRQVPAHITDEIIPRMQSLPKEAKRILMETVKHIDYDCQMLLINTATGRADSWVPSSADLFADDWEIVL